MIGTAVSCALGVVLVMVVSVAVWRLARGPAGGPGTARYPGPLLHLVMALGMAAMLVPGGQSLRPVLWPGFVATAIGLLAWTALAVLDRAGRSAARGGHRLHHVAMAAIMALMVGPARGPRTGPGPMGDMAMPVPTPPGHTASLPLLAAFAYAAGSACVIVWRSPAAGPDRHCGSGEACGSDALGRGCEILMLVSTAVMLLPAI